MKNLYSPNVDETTVDNLISGTLVPCKVIASKLETGNGILKRGTLLRFTGNVNTGFTAITSAEHDITGILLLDVDTDDVDECIGAPVGFSGEFNQNRIEEVMEMSIDESWIIEARGRQIYIAPMGPAPEAFTI